MIRIDMSEYMEKHSVSRLIGSPPGYVGYENGGQLTESVRRRPYSVLLFDEIEKAHSDIFDVMLQILDDGIVTDGQGRTVDFKNTIIILTSNIGSQEIINYFGINNKREEIEKIINNLLTKTFKPEFINRLDESIIFNGLNKEDLSKIIKIQIKKLTQRLKEKKFDLEINEDVIRLIAEKSFNPLYGARPLKREIQKQLITPIAKAILKGKFQTGDTIRACLSNNGLSIY
tara:strand:- start:55 stop:744 length:690 start_codon:yes stop_codon:yes gene_type:complete